MAEKGSEFWTDLNKEEYLGNWIIVDEENCTYVVDKQVCSLRRIPNFKKIVSGEFLLWTWPEVELLGEFMTYLWPKPRWPVQEFVFLP